MLYLISGASRSGKTMLTRLIHQQKNIPYLSTDWLMMGFNDGIPEVGINHLLWPDQIAEKMWPFLEGMINNMLFDGMDYIIEGEAIMPEHIAQLINLNPNRVKAVFLGYTSINIDEKLKLIKSHSQKSSDWLTKEPDEYVRDHINNMIRFSTKIKTQCELFSLSYIDTSEDFPDSINRAMKFLIVD